MWNVISGPTKWRSSNTFGLTFVAFPNVNNMLWLQNIWIYSDFVLIFSFNFNKPILFVWISHSFHILKRDTSMFLLRCKSKVCLPDSHGSCKPTFNHWRFVSWLFVCHRWCVQCVWTVKLSLYIFLFNKHIDRHRQNRCKNKMFAVLF